MADYIVPLILFVLFALFSSIGAFLIVTKYRGNRGDGSRAAGIVAALLTLIFFAALFWGLLVLMPPGTIPGN